MNSKTRRFVRTALSGAVVIALGASLAACGGGGGGNGVVGITAPTAPTPAPPPPPPPPAPPAPTPTADNTGNVADQFYTQAVKPVTQFSPISNYTPYMNAVDLTNADVAQAAGVTGKGVLVGVLDGGVDPTDKTLQGKIAYFYNTFATGSVNPLTEVQTDDTGHGTTTAQLIASSPDAPSLGGVAPGSQLVDIAVCGGGTSVATDTCNPNNVNLQRAITHGAKIINLSMDEGDMTTSLSAEQGIATSLDPTIINGDALTVIGTGDFGLGGVTKGQSNAGQFAGTPSADAKLRPYVIAATGVTFDSTGMPILTPANGSDNMVDNAVPCGAAAAWCLAAPDVSFTAGAKPDFTSGGGIGTSGSTAIISGVAALVSQVYPWMTAPQLQDTLFTTAIPLVPKGDAATANGVPTYNAVFGWGMVNASAAVNGPEQFLPTVGANSIFTATVPGGMTSIFANDIVGNGGLTVNNAASGTLALTGNDSYTGPTTVNTGTLVLNGTLSASPVTVGTAGTLVGMGVIGGDLTVNGSGTLYSGWTGGKGATGLQVNGNLTLASGASTNVQIGEPLKVGGTATLAGTLTVHQPAKGYVPASALNIVEAGTLNGKFSKASLTSGAGFYQGEFAYGSNVLTLDLTQQSASAEAAENPYSITQTKAAAATVDPVLTQTRQWVADGQGAAHAATVSAVGDLLDSPTAQQAASSLNSMAGAVYAADRATEFQQMLGSNGQVMDHERGIGNGSHWNVWAEATGTNGALTQSGFGASSYRFGGWLAGVDAPSFGAFRLGAVAGTTRGDVDMNGVGGHTDTREQFVNVLGKAFLPDGYYIAGAVGAANFKDGTRRTLVLGSSDYSILSNRTDRMQSVNVEFGRALQMDGFWLNPYVSVADLRLQQDGFAETGSALGLAAPSQDHNVLEETGGVRVSHPFVWAAGSASWNVNVAYHRISVGANTGMLASFTGIPGATFRSVGQGLPGNFGSVNAGVTTALGHGWSWNVGAGYAAGNRGYHGAQAETGVSWKF